MEKKELLVYDKNKYDEFLKKLPLNASDIYPISYLLDKNIALRYTSITGVDKLVLDITVMILSAQVRQDLRILYESWISELNNEHKDDIYYCVDRRYIKEACDIFDYYFECSESFYEEVQNLEEVHENSVEKINEEKVNSIVQYGQNEFEELMNNFDKRLYGHVSFKKDLREHLKSFILLHKMQRKKIFSMFLCGKSGIGKTEVGRILQELMYSGEKTIKINFGNYSGKGSLWSLIGSPKGYVGSEQGGELSNKIKKSKSKVIVIDELDKADESIFTFFYEMLEDGQFTDLDENVVDLSGYLVIFTANLNNSNFRDKIPEPLFSRFDMTYEFEPLSKDDINKFVSEYIENLISDYQENISTIDDVQRVKKKIIEMDYAKSNNLRNIKRDIMNEFVKAVGLENIWRVN